MYVGQSTARGSKSNAAWSAGVEAVPHRHQVVDLVDRLALGVEAVQLDVLERPLDLRRAWLSSLAANSACLPRSGSACSTCSPRSITVLARLQLPLHPAAAGEAATRARRSAGPRLSYSGCSVNQPLTLSTSVRYFSGLMPPRRDLGDRAAPRSGPSAATAMIAATTRSTGITSTVPSGTPGNSLQQAAGVGDDHRLGHAEAADPARARLGQRRLDDRRPHDAAPARRPWSRSAPARRAPW